MRTIKQLLFAECKFMMLYCVWWHWKSSCFNVHRWDQCYAGESGNIVIYTAPCCLTRLSTVSVLSALSYRRTANCSATTEHMLVNSCHCTLRSPDNENSVILLDETLALYVIRLHLKITASDYRAIDEQTSDFRVSVSGPIGYSC